MPGYLNLPSWRDYFLSKLIDLDLRDMLAFPVLGKESADRPWMTLDSEDFAAEAKMGISFFKDQASTEFGGCLITSDADTALARLYNGGYSKTFFSGALGGVSSFMRVLCSGRQISEPVKIFAQNDGIINYILSEIEHNGRSLEEAVHDSMWEKISDRNPIKNFHGLVARDRFILLIAELFGILLSPENINSVGINNLDIKDVQIAKTMNYSLRLLGIAELCKNGKIKAVSEPCLIPSAYLLAQARGGNEILYAKNSDGFSQVYASPGASVDSCLNGIFYDYYEQKCIHRRSELIKADNSTVEEFKDSFYIRLEAADKGKTMAAVFSHFEQCKIGIKRILDIPSEGKNLFDLVLITEPEVKSKISYCIKALSSEYTELSLKALFRFITKG